MNSSLTNIQELEFLSALETRGESPLKFVYVGEGYKEWIKIAEKSRDNHTIQYEEDLLKKETLPFIFRKIDAEVATVNIIDFGCGDGVPMIPIFSYLNEFSPSIRYIAVDISENMLRSAEETIKKHFDSVEVVPLLFDFEKGEILEEILRLANGEGTQNYFFLLGNTLGNFDNTEKVLTNLKLSMFSGDSLIIGNQVSNLFATQKLIQYYNEQEPYKLVTSTLLNYGMKCSFKEFDVRWNSQKRQVEMFLVANEPKSIEIAGRKITFEKGEEILLAISKKFAEQDPVEVFTQVGFRVDLFTTNQKKDTCITAITPTRYRTS